MTEGESKPNPAQQAWQKFRGLPLGVQLVAGIVLLAVLGGILNGGPKDEASTATTAAEATTTTAKKKPTTTTVLGNPDVYARIAAMTDCSELQAEFDTAMDNVERYPAGSPQRKIPMAYADAADERLEDVGCYG